jgi:hypothetical protein
MSSMRGIGHVFLTVKLIQGTIVLTRAQAATFLSAQTELELLRGLTPANQLHTAVRYYLRDEAVIVPGTTH